MQKFAARMDTIGANIEQALKEVQLARSSIDVAGEKTIAELTDTSEYSQSSSPFSTAYLRRIYLGFMRFDR